MKEEHPHDAMCVKEEWDEFLEIYVYLVKNICMFTRSIGDAYMKNFTRTSRLFFGVGNVWVLASLDHTCLRQLAYQCKLWETMVTCQGYRSPHGLN